MPVPVSDKTKIKRYTLNALRGFSAVFVVFYHMVGYGKFLDPGYLPASFKFFHDEGHLRVLIFFVISGTVISLSNKQNLTARLIPVYLKKRALRIYPIYAASLIITLLVCKKIYSIGTIAGNFAFLQVLFTNVILENGPIWTLHYEVLFYFLFIPLSMFNIEPLKIALAAVIIGLANYFLEPYVHTTIITSYCFGFAFWLLGLVIVRYFKTKDQHAVNYKILVSFLFLIIALPYLNHLEKASYEYAMKYLGHYIEFSYGGDINNWFKVAFSFADLTYIPYCFMAIILFSNRHFRFMKLIYLFLQLIPAYALLRIYQHNGFNGFHLLIFPITCYLISWLLLIVNFSFIKKVSEKIIDFLISMGGISYGTYIIHAPVLFFFSRISYFSGSEFTFSIRMILYFITTYSLAYFLEIIYQKWIVDLLQKKKMVT
jgi:peptidoglycan/LPS O-acetylase OafA/YrhL